MGDVVTLKRSESAGQARALGLFLLERYDEAAAVYDELLRQDPENMFFWENRMICQAEQNSVKASFFDQMIKHLPRLSAQGHLCLARVLQKMDKTDEAFVFVNKALELAPDSVDAVLLKAELLRKMNRDDELYKLMCSLYPRLKKDERVLCLAAHYTVLFGNERQALWLLKRALKLNRPYVIQNALFYQTLLYAGQSRKEMEYALEATEMSDKNTIPWEALSSAAADAEEYDTADNAYLLLSRKKPLSEEQRLNWVNVLTKIGKYDEAFDLMMNMPQDSDEWLKRLLLLFRSMQYAGLTEKSREKAGSMIDGSFCSPEVRFICDMILQNDRQDAVPLPVIRLMNNENAGTMQKALGHPAYLGPMLLEKALKHSDVQIAESLKVLDLGCGVGNMAAVLEKFSRPAGVLDGVDISLSVLNYAVGLDKYDTVNENDLVSFCKAKENAKRYNVIVCMNVFQYFSDLTQAFRAVKSALAPGGIFVFSVLPLTDSEKKFAFQSSGWFYHASDYVSGRLNASGLKKMSETSEVLFKFGTEEIRCSLFVAQKKK